MVERCLKSLDGVEASVLAEQGSGMWLCYLEYLVRCVDWEGGEQQQLQLQRFREAAQRAVAMMRDSESSLFRYSRAT